MTEDPVRACPICLSVGARSVLHRQLFFGGPVGEGYDVCVCATCGGGFADGIPSQSQLDLYYTECARYTNAHQGGLPSLYDTRRFERLADEIEAHLPSRDARILDIGCATGGLLAALQKRGYKNLLGSDPSAACAETAKRLSGLDVRVATLAEHVRWAERFDCITAVGVLEHLHDLQSGISTISRLLSSGGIVFVAQPDVEAFAETTAAPFQQFSVEHINFFSQNTLRFAFGAMGFGAKSISRWLLEWQEGVCDSVLCGTFRREDAPGLPVQACTATRPALEEYISACTKRAERVRDLIAHWVDRETPLWVWGTGTQTLNLLATTRLREATVLGFINSSAKPGETLMGKPILRLCQVPIDDTMIVISAYSARFDIRRAIASDSSRRNPVLTLYEAEAVEDRGEISSPGAEAGQK